MKKILLMLLAGVSVLSVAGQARWSAEKANNWYKQQDWSRGCNYQPSTVINQLEMFQAATFDPATINRELGWAQNLGFNTMRVFLHHIAWSSDKDGFKKRLNQYLGISDKHGIKTILVFFDDCWNDEYHAGKQPEPKTGIHNSGWVRDPGTVIRTNPDSLKMLESYVKDIMTMLKDDKRVLLWDLYNEPGNNQYFDKSLPLLKSVFGWAREVGPSQPVSAGVWNWGEKFAELNKFELENSDVITYHNYAYIDAHIKRIEELQQYGRPLICTEYMARKNASLFQTIMPVLKKNKIGAINWGFVSGKTNTIYAWGVPMPDGKEPELWFHDILRKDGTPFSEDEVNTIKSLTKKSKLHSDHQK
ncbi:MAG: 1,4-beta-xylanase [Mucilaginibacter sp.]|nr:1,4-beta-xylanase [Mucilaginibacter sp.]